MLCKFCQYDIPAEDIELGQRLAKCRGCNQVFTIDLQPKANASPSVPLSTFTPAKPEKLKLVDENGQGYMQWSWFHPMAFGLLVFCIAWDSFLFFWYFNALFGMGANAPGGFHWLAILFPIGHLAVGVGLTYYTLCLFLNRTQVVFDGAYLIVRSGPIPTFRNKSVPREDIRRFESDSQVASSKGGPRYTYQLFAVVADNSRKSLVSYESDPALIRYVQWQLESWLSLPQGRTI